MIISYHNVCPFCAKINKADVNLEADGKGMALVPCEECNKLYVFLVSTKKVED